MGPIELKSAANVRRHREDICKALGIPFTEDMLTDDYFIGRFLGEQRDFLDSQGLLNRGFCPLCGNEPIGTEHKRGLAYSRAVEYLCGECYERTNPHSTIPGYTARYYAVKSVVWIIVLAVLVGGFLLLRACVRLVF